jgi:5-methylcytosine-specific restriction endonuclease McrA
MKNKQCVVCGENDLVVLEFDHINPSEKSFAIARAISDGLKWEVILQEIRKCQILCANCHKRKTAVEFGWYQKVKNLL